jgi:Cof subfamily protein (haloacid dehalogenase superfamily)
VTPLRSPARRISAVVSDLDGTLVTASKQVTGRTRAAVAALRQAGLPFCVISSRPPRGMVSVLKALQVVTPSAAFNGSVIVAADGAVLKQHFITPEAARQAIEFLIARSIDVWVFSGQDWLIRNATGPHVDLETRTVGFRPVVVSEFGQALEAAAKVVGVSEDHDSLALGEAELAPLLGTSATVARSQLYYLDVTDRLANKGEGVLEIANLLGVPTAEIAVIGDGGNDVAMFEQAGLSIAMGNARPAVKAMAHFATDSNEADGFAKAVDRFILGGERRAPGRS